MVWASALLLLSGTSALMAGSSGRAGKSAGGSGPVSSTVSSTGSSTPRPSPMSILNEVVIDGVKFGIDVLYKNKDIQRFYVLETVARVPYFAFASVLHLKETLGDRRGSELLRLHYSQADNELAHLLIMESLGGNSSAIDRTVAAGMAMGFFWYATLLYAVAPHSAYHLSELIEAHAFKTYDAFLQRNEDDLKQKPVPTVAKDYYCHPNPFLFHLSTFNNRRPILSSLYDVFINIRDDEQAHWSTLADLRGQPQYPTLHDRDSLVLQDDIPADIPTQVAAVVAHKKLPVRR